MGVPLPKRASCVVLARACVCVIIMYHADIDDVYCRNRKHENCVSLYGARNQIHNNKSRHISINNTIFSYICMWDNYFHDLKKIWGREANKLLGGVRRV